METPRTHSNLIPKSPFARVHPGNSEPSPKNRPNITDILYGSPSLVSPLHRPNYSRMHVTPASSSTSDSANTTPTQGKSKGSSSHVSMQMITNSIRKHSGNATDVDAIASKLLHIHLDNKGLQSLLPLPVTTDSFGKPVLSKAMVYLSKCPNLAAVYLDQNQIHDLQGLSLLTGVTSLHLEHNQLQDTRDITEMRKVKLLYLSHNPLHTVHMPLLSQCEEMYLANCIVKPQDKQSDASRHDSLADSEIASSLFQNIDSHLGPNVAHPDDTTNPNPDFAPENRNSQSHIFHDTLAGPPSPTLTHVQLTPETVFALSHSLVVLDLSGCGLQSLRAVVRVKTDTKRREQSSSVVDEHGDARGDGEEGTEGDQGQSADHAPEDEEEQTSPLLLAELQGLKRLNLSNNNLTDAVEVVELCRSCSFLEELDIRYVMTHICRCLK